MFLFAYQKRENSTSPKSYSGNFLVGNIPSFWYILTFLLEPVLFVLGIVVPFEYCGEFFSFPKYSFVGTFKMIHIKREIIDKNPMFTR